MDHGNVPYETSWNCLLGILVSLFSFLEFSNIKPQQIENAKKNCAKLYKKCVPSGGNFFVIMDDETYMELNPQESKKKEWYSVVPGHEPPEEDRITQKSKFPAKMLIWQAITQVGR